MRRAALTIVATVIGLVLLLQFKSNPASTTTGGLANLGNAVTPRPHPHASRHRSTPPPPQRSTITGQAVQTPYGVVQVRIIETGTRLTNVVPLELPHDSARSSQIAASAAPLLRNEALRADSASIDVVSGATYTSDGYAQSLQSALDHA